ncbi:hypothetical protein ABIA31_008906 [Catenulispora sp. MAP5-51]
MFPSRSTFAMFKPLASLVAVTTAIATVSVVGAASPSATAATAATAGYTISIGAIVQHNLSNDTPDSAYIDRDGSFHVTGAHSLYGPTDSRQWKWYSGTTFDDAADDATRDSYVNPSNSNDRNDDTTWRCNNSPTGVTATYTSDTGTYAQKNYCDIVGTWIDPDTGDWYGLVHNEFTPEPFGAYSFSHYDGIDYTVSHDQGRTWSIVGHAITSPYSTARGDTTAFPHETWDYGDGDPRLFVDTASGFFYVFYGTRIVGKASAGGGTADLAHVARAPISGKMATGTWSKWYDGAWTQPGVGGLESNLVPLGTTNPDGTTNQTGFTPVAVDYNPQNSGTVTQQIAAHTLPPTSPLFVMDIAYDAYLGLYIGEPESVDRSGNAPQQYYATSDLASQKWTLLGDTGAYHTASWYRWLVDTGNKTVSNQYVGKTMRAYCGIACSGSSGGEYATLTIDSSAPAAVPVDLSKTYAIGTADGRVLAQVSGGTATTSDAAPTGSALQAWSFVADGDGSYQIRNAGTGQALGVDSTATAGRSWGAKPTATTIPGSGATVGQQWWIVADNAPAGTFRIINRYSDLDLALSSDTTRLAETTPTRTWDNSIGNTVGGARTAAEQTLTLTATGSGTETVSVTNPGAQTGTVGTAVSLQMAATDTQNKALTYSATGLPAGLSISGAGLISGTPTAAATASVTVTANSGTASGSTTFSWTVNPTTPVLSGTHTIIASGKALDDPNHSTSPGTQLIIWSPNNGANQNWVFTRQPDGSYQIVNGQSNLCMDDNGGFTTPGTAVIQWTCTGGTNQHWTVTKQADNLYKIVNVHSGLLLTTASTADGALVTQQTDTGSALQQWSIS